jgi:ATP-dependent exoDNAse (exonuclease V) alpha subunit
MIDEKILEKREKDFNTIIELLFKLKYPFPVFLTGKSGAGKTHLTKQVIEWAESNGKNVLVTGMTGVAARNIHHSASTIHSTLKLGIINSMTEYYSKKRNMDENLISLLNNTDLIIIDEISMARAEFIDVIFYHLKRYSYEGAIMVVGDFYQLPPVIKNYEEISEDYYYAFQSKNWAFYSIVLDEVLRTSDPDFIEFSNMIRNCSGTPEQWERFISYINQQDYTNFAEQEIYNSICLFATNKEANDHNEKRLNELEGEEKRFIGKFTRLVSWDIVINNPHIPPMYEDSNYSNYYSLCNVEPLIKLKVGARVMHLVNNPELNLINGDMGTVVDFITDFTGELLPVVQWDNGEKNVVNYHNFDFEYKVGDEYISVARIMQLPLRLAYGLTVHKTQGLSLDSVFIDAGNFFNYQQFYVAFTRARDPKKLIMKDFDLSFLKNYSSDLIPIITYYNNVDYYNEYYYDNYIKNLKNNT